MEREIHVLFVDDQWCTAKGRNDIIAAFGDLLKTDPPCVFHYETAETTPGNYSIEPVLKKIAANPQIDIIVLDIMFGDKGDRLGLKILEALREKFPVLPVIMMTSLGKDHTDEVETAMKLGANEYLIKKPIVEEFERCLRIYTQLSGTESDFAIWGNSPAIRKTRALIARETISGNASVLITGESGTGKELVARAIHRQGPRRHGPFIDKNCANAKSELLDSDLFGHERGSFTGAYEQHIGRIEQANGGILFLDEIGSMPEELQQKLLRVLETREFQRLGGRDTIRSDFQLVCATNENLDAMVKNGRFRQDLYYRINLFDIVVPPLRQRQEDIPVLVGLFLKKYKAGQGASYTATAISPEAMELLVKYPWPGNVRELKNIIERAVIRSRNISIGPDELPPEFRLQKPGDPPSSALNNGEQAGTMVDSEPGSWGIEFARLQLEYVAQSCENGLSLKMKATEIVNNLWPREPKGKAGKGSTEKLKAFLNQIAKAPWGCPGVRTDPACIALCKRIEMTIAALGRKDTTV
jgi:DNA-binding NtrC family response regulator